MTTKAEKEAKLLDERIDHAIGVVTKLPRPIQIALAEALLQPQPSLQDIHKKFQQRQQELRGDTDRDR